MTREQYIVLVPKEWKKNKKAGLCAVCGKTPDEFEKGRRVYCSLECADKFSSCFITWNSLREKILLKYKKCAKCGATEESWNKKEKEKVTLLNEGILTKYSKEIEAWKMSEIAKAENDFILQMKKIQEIDLDDWDMKSLIEKLGETVAETKYYPGFEVDHIIAVGLGGDMWDEKNLQVLCKKPCHTNKTKEDMKKMRQLKY